MRNACRYILWESQKIRKPVIIRHLCTFAPLTVKQWIKEEICKCVLLQILLFSETVAYFTIKTLILQQILAVELSKCDC